jgi:serine/threonine-protein kinase
VALTSGTRLGPYEILSALGAGGMGEVYRATDVRLKRQVAVKILPPSLAADPERLARFQREAEVLASLNHPHIAQIYGLEDADGVKAFVMELIEGEDLAERIARGSIPLDEALSMAKQIAEALEAAHEQGIIHRDLKPANVKVRPDGTVKVLDFGLAKMLESKVAPASLSMPPTITSPAMTQMGVMLGTAAYMAPEQARGATVDKRADIWAFGCVLFEMLAGRRVFDSGQSVSDAVAAILKTEPDWPALPAATPQTIRALLKRCLEKDSRQRLRDIGDARLVIADAMRQDGTVESEMTPRSQPRRLGRWAAATGWIVAAVLLVMAVWFASRRSSVVSPRPMRLALPLATPIETLGQSLYRQFTLSPDGTRLVYVGRQADTSALHLLDVATGEVKRLPDTNDAYGPFFSPDGGSIGFMVGTSLRTLQLAGGLVRDLGAVRTDLHSDAAWTQSDGILLPDARGLSRRSVSGGQPSIVATLGAEDGRFGNPHPLPGGDGVLVSVRAKRFMSTDDESQVGVVSLRTGAMRILVERGSSPAFVADPQRSPSAGYLVYAYGGRLFAAPFDVQGLTTKGSPVPVVDNIEMRPNGDAAQFSVSTDGTVVYREGAQAELVWVDRAGAARRLSSALKRFAIPRLSPDGRSLAVEVQDTPHQIWLLDIERDVFVPLTKGAGGSHNFTWAPDGRAIAFTSIEGGSTRVAWMRTDGSGETTTIFQAADVRPWVERGSRDGRFLLVSMRDAPRELAMLPLDGASPPTVTGALKPIVNGATAASFSPNGQWVAYCDCLSGAPTPQVFVRRLSDGTRFQASTDGGSEPLWASTGRELFFRAGTRMMVVDLTFTPDIRIGKPRTLFEGDYLGWGSGDFDVTADGQRFVMVRPANPETAAKTLSVRLNWMEELKARVPVK